MNTASDQSGPPKRRVGRPRISEVVLSDDPSEDILGAAAALFASVGYTATTTRQIADAAGLRQASMFHYFARKEDLLAELLDRTVEPALRFGAWLDTVDSEPDISLATLVRYDVTNLCSLPHNLGTLILLPESRNERFDGYWAKREGLRVRYRSLLDAGVASKRLRSDDVAMSTDVVFGLVESVITWHPRRRAITPEQTSDAIVDVVLGALVPRRDRIPSILRRSDELLEVAAKDLAAGPVDA